MAEYILKRRSDGSGTLYSIVPTTFAGPAVNFVREVNPRETYEQVLAQIKRWDYEAILKEEADD